MGPLLRPGTLVLIVAVLAGAQPRATRSLPAAFRQRAAGDEKAQRTPEQRKIDSQLLYEIYRARGLAKEKHVPPGPTGVRFDARRRALVDIRADVTPALEKTLRQLGATIVDTSREFRSVIAWVPVLKLEALARTPSVRAINPAPEPVTVK